MSSTLRGYTDANGAPLPEYELVAQYWVSAQAIDDGLYQIMRSTKALRLVSKALDEGTHKAP